jgi:hypothetical protein
MPPEVSSPGFRERRIYALYDGENEQVVPPTGVHLGVLELRAALHMPKSESSRLLNSCGAAWDDEFAELADRVAALRLAQLGW